MIKAILMMLVVGGVLGLILGIAGILFDVKVDERVANVTTLLPGYNCGGCGYPGCAGLAEALVDKKADSVSLCKPSKVEQRAAIVDYLKTTPGPNGDFIEVKI